MRLSYVRRKLFALSVLLVVCGCSVHSGTVTFQPESVYSTPSISSQPIGTHNAAGIELVHLRDVINQARSDAGLQALASGPKLDMVAQRYARVLAQAGRIAHSGVDGTTLTQRINRVGLTLSYYNENLAAGYTEPGQVVARWLGSPGHRDNMLSPQIAHVGLGYARAGPGDRLVHYWVMVGGQR